MSTIFSNINTGLGTAKLESPDEPIKAVLNLVENQLPEFANRIAYSKIRNEKGLTQKLIRLLNKFDIYPFFFDKDGMEDETKGNSPNVDIDVIGKDFINVNSRFFKPEERFFCFEAKILGVEENYRLKEYVIGYDNRGNQKPCGGIERFKRHLHGQNLNYAGMIGYVLKKDFDFWFKNVNQWIEEISVESIDKSIPWSNDDKLIMDMTNKELIHKYTSINSRIENINPIFLYHLWVKLEYRIDQ